ncbi:YbjQ family protein [Microbacterium sp. 22195]|uniref:YbjQ family protein n=1 Tax=Microbacterium sp. 22195 TaxID=3453891 RepID=UPI003F876CD5
MFTMTTNDVPGYRITQVLGEVMGLTVRSSSFGQGFTAGFRSLGGGEIPEFSQVLYESRMEAVNRMWAEAVQRGANAVVAMRYDNSSVQNFFEICAYGTAVVIEPLEPPAS